MSLGKRICNHVSVILEIDDAIQLGSDYTAYRDSFFDEKYLVLSGNATHFVIRQLTSEQKDFVSSSTTLRQQAKNAIRCGLVSISGYEIQKADGSIIDPPMVELEDSRAGKVISEKWLNDLNLPSDQLAKLYLLIDYISEAQLPLSRQLDRESMG